MWRERRRRPIAHGPARGLYSSPDRSPNRDFQHETDWIQLWHFVSQLQGLTTLEVNVTYPPTFWLDARDRQWKLPAASRESNMDYGLLGPLRAMKKLDRFDLNLPDDCEKVRLKEDDPFQIKFHDIRDYFR